MKIKKEHFILLIIILAGSILRYLLFTRSNFIGLDAVALSRLGKNFVEYGKYSFGENFNWGLFFPPAFPLLTGSLNFLVHDLFISGKLVSLAANIFTIVLLYFTGEKLENEDAGLFLAFIFSFHPSMIAASSAVATESLFIFLFFTVFYVYLVSLNKKFFSIYLLMGLTIGMAYLTRPEGILLLLLPILSARRLSDFKDLKFLVNILVVFAVVIFLASPYLLFIKHSTGKWSLSGKSGYLSVILNEGVSSEEIEYDIAAYSLENDKSHLNAFDPGKHLPVAGYIVNNPVKFTKKYIGNLTTAFKRLFGLLLPVFLPLLLLPFDTSIFRDKKILSILLLAFIYLVIYPPFLILTRHMFITSLLLITLSSVVFSHSAFVYSRIFHTLRLQDIPLFRNLAYNFKYLIIIFSMSWLASGDYSTLKVERDIPSEHIKAGYFLKSKVSSIYEKLNVMHRTPWVSFYSGARYTMFPYANYEDAVNFARRYHVDFIVVDSRSSMKNWENYDELINLNKYSNDVDLIYEDSSSELIRIFKLVKLPRSKPRDNFRSHPQLDWGSRLRPLKSGEP